MRSGATTPAAYLAELPEDRRRALSKIRAVIRKNLPRGIREGVQYGMIGYFVPHSIYPAGYHCDPAQPLPYASLASQKNHMAIYLFGCYMDEARTEAFRQAWLATGKRLDMGKGCVRFKRLEDVPLEVVGEAIGSMTVEAFVARYEAGLPASKRRPGALKA